MKSCVCIDLAQVKSSSSQGGSVIACPCIVAQCLQLETVYSNAHWF